MLIRPAYLAVGVFLFGFTIGGFAQSDTAMLESNFSATTGVAIPQAPREFRGVWVAAVSNLDWPSAPGLSSEQQQRELVAILDKVKALHMNAVILQVRTGCDALYASSLEPWSYYLTGEMGRPPSPYYDPLAFAVEEAHKRGLELHAWFNPFRALTPGNPSVAPNHVSKTRPEIVRKVGSYLWLDPGMKETQEYSLSVILDVVRRYDIDGIQIDDYFYPYPDSLDGRPFPDSATYEAYKRSGGRASLGDWRRGNVDRFVERMYKDTKKLKPWVKVGISPFGIWRPEHPKGVQGLDQYAELYADARLWVEKGWGDYWSPQLYWALNSNQSYSKLLNWWVGENLPKRHVWPGIGVHRLTSSMNWPTQEIVNQVEATRRQPGATGEVFFGLKSIMQGAKGIDSALASSVYTHSALVPASPWLDSTPPPPPRIGIKRDSATGVATISLQPGGERPFLWAVYSKHGPIWRLDTLPGNQAGFHLAKNAQGREPDLIAISALDRVWNESPRMVIVPAKAAGTQ